MNKIIPVSFTCSFVCTVSTAFVALGQVPGCESLSQPKIGDVCTQKVTIKLRKVESDGKDEFNRPFEPNPGWVIENHNVVERGRTGEASGPTITGVQVNSKIASLSQIEFQEKALFDFLAEKKAKASAAGASAESYAKLEVNAKNEFSNFQRNVQQFSSNNAGLNIQAWVAVQGGCKTRVFGSCINWGPGGSLDADVVVFRRYVGTSSDAENIKNKYIEEAKKIVTNVLPDRKLEACMPVYNPSTYRPGQPGWTGHIGKIAFANTTSTPINVTLYNPDAPQGPFKKWAVQPNQNIFLDSNNYGMDWGIQVNNDPVCIVGRVSGWNSFNGESIFQSRYPTQIRN